MAPRRLVLCDRLAETANSSRMERQILLVHFERERDANRADARELMRLIAKVEVRMNHKAALIKEIEILTGSIPVVQDDKGKLTGIESVDNIEKRIQNVKEILYKEK
nr:hypothetical protein [Tanacetum cinerariifolium]